MNMFKKLVSLTLCVFVALGAVACGSAPASGPEPSPSASGSTSESQATSEVEGEKDENHQKTKRITKKNTEIIKISKK